MSPQLRAHAAIAGAALLVLGACSENETLILGASKPRPFRFEAPERVAELSVEARSDNPSLTGDLLEIFFTASTSPIPGPGTGDVWTATRRDASEAFDAPRMIEALSSSATETSPVIAADGLTLWLASDRPGGRGDLDVYVATRATRVATWSAPSLVDALSSEARDIPRPPGLRERVMPLGSDRDTPGYYQIYFAQRGDTTAPFAAPELVEELSVEDVSTVDGFLTADGLTLFYVTGPSIGPADLYMASRRVTDEAFELVTPLDTLNTESDERDPWLSEDGTLFYFASDRSGRYAIYVARATR
jgi:hypothetical protein